MTVHPSREDAVVRALSESVGGPMGDRATRHPWWTPVRVLLLLTAFVFCLGMIQKAPCSVAEGKDQNWTYSHMCYTDLRPLYIPRGFAEHAWPYSEDEQTRDRYEVMEYPVGIAYWAWGASWVTQGLNGFPDLETRYKLPVSDLWGEADVKQEITIFVLVNAVGLAAFALLCTWLLAGTNRRRPWDAAAFALSPALLLTGLINWDLLAVACVAGAMWAWARDRPVLTGVLIGLGAAVKLYPLFLLGAVLILCLRQRRWRDLALTNATAVLAWAITNLPAYLSGPDQWKVFWSFNSARAADLGSLWMVIDQAGDVGFSAHTINVWSWIIFGAWCLGVFALGMTASRRRAAVGVRGAVAGSRPVVEVRGALAGSQPVVEVRGAPATSLETPFGGLDTVRFAQLGYLIVVGFLLVNKVYSPQYVLWLLPLAVLARPRWRDQLIWQGCEILYFCTVWWYLGGYLNPAGGGDAGFYWVGIVVRALGELYLAAMIVRDMYRPEQDPVSRSLVDVPAPAAGVSVSQGM